MSITEALLAKILTGHVKNFSRKFGNFAEKIREKNKSRVFT
jgi:hypothetical protein